MNIKDLHIKIEAKATPLHFQQCHVDTFKADLRHDLKELVQLSSQPVVDNEQEQEEKEKDGQRTNNKCLRDFLHCNENIVEKMLFPTDSNRSTTSAAATSETAGCALHWEKLCMNYDQYYKNTATRCVSACDSGNVQLAKIRHGSISFTALEAIMELILDPTIIPSCFVTTIFIGLLSVVKKVLESQKSSSMSSFSQPFYISQIQKISHEKLSFSTSSMIKKQQQCQLKSINFIQSIIHSLISSRSRSLHATTITSSYQYPIQNFLSTKLLLLSSYNDLMMKIQNIINHENNSYASTSTITMQKKLLKTFVNKRLSERNCSTMTNMISFLQNVILQTISMHYNVTSSLVSSPATIIPFTSIFVPTLSLLVNIDNLDILLLYWRQQQKIVKSNTITIKDALRTHHREQKNKSTTHTICTECQKILNDKPSRTMTSQMSDLHDEQLSDNDDGNVIDLRCKKMRFSKYPSRGSVTSGAFHKGLGSMTLTKMMTISSDLEKRMKERESCYLCVARNETCSRNSNAMKLPSSSKRGKDITALPIHAVYFRAFLYYTVVSITKLSISLNNTVTKYSTSSRTLIDAVFQDVIAMVIREPYSSSLRYCAVIMAHHLGIRQGYRRYLNSLLQFYRRWNSTTTSLSVGKVISSNITGNGNRSSSMDSLMIYCEVVVECSVFDDPNECWVVIRPLISLAITLSEEFENDQKIPTRSDQYHHESRQKSIFLLQCAGYLLLKRNKFLSNNKMNHEVSSCFNQYVIKCSNLFSDSSVWLHPLLTKEERCETIFVLQKFGIISFLDGNFAPNVDIDEATTDQTTQSSKQLFVDTIREAFERIGPMAQGFDIFTDYDEVVQNEFMSDERHKNSLKRKRREIILEEKGEDSERIEDYIHEDITRYIFSFLGYKLLVRVTAVCKQWNKIGNENFFWKHHYQNRFKIRPVEELLPDTIEPRFRAKFIEKEKNDMKEINWRHLFDKKWKKERLQRGTNKVIGNKAKTCGFLCCLTVIKSLEQKKKHDEIHKRKVMKQISIWARAEERMAKREAAHLKKKKAIPFKDKKNETKLMGEEVNNGSHTKKDQTPHTVTSTNLGIILPERYLV